MPDSPQAAYAFGPFTLDPLEKVVFRDGIPIPLTPKAVETLLVLVARPGRVVTKDELLRAVWPDTFVEENNLAQNISMLRRALGTNTDGASYIETVPKRGYRFVGAVTEQGGGPADSGAQPLTTAPSSATPTAPVPRENRRAGVLLLSGLIAVVFLALALVVSTRVRERTPGSRPAGTEDVIRMVVLPFVNLGPTEDEYFAAGITEEITGRLAGLRQAAVVSSTTATGYDRGGKSARQIGEELGVDYVIEGSVRWARSTAGPQVRITPKLIRASDDTAVWTQQYDASPSDLFAVQSDIAYRLAGALQVALEGRERRLFDARPTADMDAYLAYLRGIASIKQGPFDTANQLQARSELEHAVGRDAKFASAWSWLARVYAWQYSSGARRNAETKRLATRAAETAIALNPELPEARLALAQLLLVDREYAGALRELDAAQRGSPNSPDVVRLIGTVERRKGRWAESLKAYLRAFDVDPASAAEDIVIHFLHLRQFGEAERYVGILNAGNRASGTLPKAWIGFSERNDIEAARRLLEPALDARSPADARARGLLARLEWFDGRHERALELIGGMDPAGAWMPANFRYPASLAAAQVYESMGRRAEAAQHYAAAWAELERKHEAAPDDYQVAAAMGLAAAGLGRAEEAVRLGQRAVRLLPVSKDAAEGPLYLYLLAEIYSRAGQPDAAFATLDEMFRVPGFYNEIWVQRDPGFATLQRHPAFGAYVARWASRKGEVLLR